MLKCKMVLNYSIVDIMVIIVLTYSRPEAKFSLHYVQCMHRII